MFGLKVTELHWKVAAHSSDSWWKTAQESESERTSPNCHLTPHSSSIKSSSLDLSCGGGISLVCSSPWSPAISGSALAPVFSLLACLCTTCRHIFIITVTELTLIICTQKNNRGTMGKKTSQWQSVSCTDRQPAQCLKKLVGSVKKRAGGNPRLFTPQ